MFENIKNKIPPILSLDYWINLYADNWDRSIGHKAGLVLLAGFAALAITGGILFAVSRVRGGK